MNNILAFSLIVFSVCTAPAALKVRVQFTPLANLTYQLDCVANLSIHCSRENYKKLWEQNFVKNDEDRNLLQKWADLRNLYSRDLRLKESEDSQEPARFEGVSLFNKFRIAGLQAKDLRDYRQRLDLVLNPKHTGVAESIVHHFYPRFLVWWKGEALKKGRGFSQQTEKLLQRADLKLKVEQFYSFYEANLPEGYELLFNLFYRPDLIKEATSGQQIDNYSLAEFRPKEKPEERIDVVIHELCHFFYDNSKTQQFSDFVKSFFESDRATAVPAYNLLNESLAASLGNGMISRITMRPKKFSEFMASERSVYNNASIDRAAKALLPMLDQWLQEKKSLYHPDFVKEYISKLEQAFGESLSAPALALSELQLVADDKFGKPFRRHVKKVFAATSMWSSEGSWADVRFLESYLKDQRINAVFIVHADNLSELEKNHVLPGEEVKLLAKELELNKRVLYSHKRASSRATYFIVARDYDVVLNLIDELAGVKAAFNGVYRK